MSLLEQLESRLHCSQWLERASDWHYLNSLA